MMPSVLVLRVGPGRGFPFLVPILLLWPLVGLAALAVLIAGRLVRPGSAAAGYLAAAWMGLHAIWHLRGLKMDAREHGGSRIYMHFV